MRLFSGGADRVHTAGRSVRAIYAGAVSGWIHNPAAAAEQGIGDEPAPLFVSISGPATTRETATTRALAPGETFRIPPNIATDVWVNSAFSGHRFAVVVVQPARGTSPTPEAAAFPPAGPVTEISTIPSWLYKQYEDDDDLQAFVQAYNDYAQEFVDWANSINLPIYPWLAGALLDWVAEGLYGIARPTLYSGESREIGTLNTWGCNEITLNRREVETRYEDVAATSDDIFKRIITWHFFKGDGKHMSIPWLKRRVGRFLFCEDGIDAPFETSQIAVIVSGGNDLSIVIVSKVARLDRGAGLNTFGCNEMTPNYSEGSETLLPVPPTAKIFIEAVQSGALELPLQYQTTARIGAIGVR